MRRVASQLVVRARGRSRPELGDLRRALDVHLNFECGYFIEAGANDGYQQSNTYVLEKTRGWSGLLVEAVPELADRCDRRRTRARVVNCALVGADYESPTVKMRFADLMSLVDGAQDSRADEDEHIAAGLKAQHLSATYSLEVPARTLTSLLDEDPPPVIDFFSLDVEGYEIQVLSGLDLDRYRPKLILAEDRSHGAVGRYLSERGYNLVNKVTHHDYLFRDRTAA